MATDESENFRVRPGRSRSRGTRINPRTQPFFKQVEIAVRKAGGDPRRIGAAVRSGSGREGGRSGRFNARGRGAKAIEARKRLRLSGSAAFVWTRRASGAAVVNDRSNDRPGAESALKAATEMRKNSFGVIDIRKHSNKGRDHAVLRDSPQMSALTVRSA